MNGVTLLIVDDDEFVRRTLSRVLGAQSNRILTAPDGRSALQLARSAAPDLIILDVNMPGLDGRQVCRALRESENTRDIPVLMLSGLGQFGDALQGLAAGADDYLAKPVDVDRLRARLESLLKPAP